MPLPQFAQLPEALRFVLFQDMDSTIEAPPVEELRAALPVIIAQRLSGLCLHALKALPPGRLALQETELLRRTAFQQAAHSARIIAESGRTLEQLRKEKVDFLVIKGPSLPKLGAGIGLRPISDIDILVRPEQFGVLVARMARFGYVESERSRAPRDYFGRYCREGLNVRSRGFGSLDIHHRISPWLWSGGLSFDAVWSSRQERKVGPFTMYGASDPVNLLVCALHIVSDQARPGGTFRVWRDVALLGRHCDPSEAYDVAVEAGLSGWLRWIFSMLPTRVRPPVLWDLLVEEGAGVAHRHRLRALLPPRLGSRHLLGNTLRLPLPCSALFLAGVAAPSSSFLSSKYPSDRYRLVHWWRDCALGVGEAARATAKEE